MAPCRSEDDCGIAMIGGDRAERERRGQMTLELEGRRQLRDERRVGRRIVSMKRTKGQDGEGERYARVLARRRPLQILDAARHDRIGALVLQ